MHKDILCLTSFVACLVGQVVCLLSFINGNISNIQTLSCHFFLLFVMVTIGILSE
jgi:hypothetical protein